MLIKTGSVLKVLEVIHTPEAYFKKDRSAFNRLASVKIGWELDPTKFLYLRARLVSGLEAHGFNANGDGFTSKELAAHHNSFVNAFVNVDHENTDPKLAIGFILDARWLPGTEEQWVEGILAIDREKADDRKPGLVAMIESGAVDETSMGCYVENSVCTSCLKEKTAWDGKTFDADTIDKYAADLEIGGGVAQIPDHYCAHIGRYMERKGGLNGAKEVNRNCNFFEQSVITTVAADSDARILEKIAQDKKTSGDWLEHMIRLNAVKNQRGGSAMTQANVAVDGLKNDTSKETGDLNGTPPDKDKALADQAKQNSDKTKDGGFKNDTMVETGDYLLASRHLLEAFATVKTLAKTNPEAYRVLMATDPTVDLGGKPESVSNGEKKEAPAQKSKAEERKPESQPPIPGEKKSDVPKEKGAVAKLFDSLSSTLASIKQAIEGTGNPLETASATGEYPNGSGDINNATFEVSRKPSPGTVPENGNPLMTKKDAPDYSLNSETSKVAYRYKVVGGKIVRVSADEEKENAKNKARLDNMVDGLQSGKPYDEAKKDTTNKFGGIVRRKQIAEELNRAENGSMGSDGKPNSIADPSSPKEKDSVKISSEEGKPMERKPEGKKAEVPPQFDKKDGLEKAPETVKKLDTKTDAVEAVMNAKKNRAALLAKGGYRAEAARNISDIDKLEAFAGKFQAYAANIENLSSGLNKQDVEGASKRALLDKFAVVLKEAVECMGGAEKEIGKMEKEDERDKDKVEVAKAKMAAEQRALVAERKKVEADNRLQSILKRQSVDDLIALGQIKGLIKSAEIQTKISEFMRLSDVEFQALKKAWASLPDMNRVAVNRRTLEASRIPAGMGRLAGEGSVSTLADDTSGDWNPLA